MHPHYYGLTKACYTVNETLNLLSIGRTSLYELVKRGDLPASKFGKKTLFYANDIASLLTRLREQSSTKAT
jgi:excisionase family DNA binding protein